MAHAGITSRQAGGEPMNRPGVLSAIGDTPLIALAKLSPPGGARVLLKWEGANPTGSMKDRMALAMVERARASGRLAPGQTIVEYTGGSTGASLAMVGAALGHPVRIVAYDVVADEKIMMMRALGAEVEILATPGRKVTPELLPRLRARVEEIRRETGAFWTAQMENPDQTEGYTALADELLAACPALTDFVQVVGTGGSSMGTSRRLKAQKSAVRTSVVEPAEAPYLSAGRGGAHTIEGIALTLTPPLFDGSLVDARLAVPEAEGRALALRLAREEGLLVGTSTGLNLAAALRVAARLPREAAVVTLAVDTGLKYLAGTLFRPT